jgi:hypothetical protein
MERKFKILLVSYHTIINAGDKFDSLLRDSLYDTLPGAKIIRKDNDIMTGSLAILLYHSAWDEAEEGECLEKIGIEFKESLIERI